MALRLTFRLESGIPVQEPVDVANELLQVVQLEGTDDIEAVLARIEHEARNHRFALDRPPLFSAVYAVHAAGGVLFMAMHHILADAVSLQILATEFQQLHARLHTDIKAALPEAPAFTDYLVPALEAAKRSSAEVIEWWHEYLLDLPPELELVYDGNLSSPPAGDVGAVALSVGDTETTQLSQLAAQANVSLFDILLATYFQVLQTASGQEDLVIRVATSNRTAHHSDAARMVGCFADSLPVRLHVTGGEALLSTIGRARKARIAAETHAPFPSTALAGLGGGRGRSGPRGLSPAGISYLNFDRSLPEKSLIARLSCTSALPFTELSLICWQFNGRLHFSWCYHGEHFDAATIDALARSYLRVLTKAASGVDASRASSASPASASPAPASPAPASPLKPATSALPAPFLPAAPLPPDLLFPKGKVLHEKLLLAMESFANRTAVECDGERLLYDELQNRVEAIAASLGAVYDDQFSRAGRAESETPTSQPLVGILASPGSGAVAGLCGILASGAAFVPLDPAWPDDRIARIAAHARLRALVTTVSEAKRVGAMEGLSGVNRLLLLDNPEGEPLEGIRVPVIRWCDRSNPPPATGWKSGLEDLAWVMYTSGTSGDPKGVMVTHRAAIIFLNWIAAAFRISPADRFAHTSSLGFGGTIRQVFSTLLAGGTICPVTPGLLREPHALLDFMRTERITVLNTVPTLWSGLLDAAERADRRESEPMLESLRLFLIGGEAMPVDTVRRWRDRFGNRHRIVNLYGSTETVVNATWHEVRERPPDGLVSVPIGIARGGSEVLLLDEERRSCALGATGELWVG
ncbi:MAG: AMP-binding protein, partial [Gemmatimonadota bacterium]|nr:AMP-binding protein [Gemmatimonadota bacterium]